MNQYRNTEIVVVDDDSDIQDLVTAFFKPKGFHVTCFSDAESALSECRKNGMSWEVVLADLNLPKLSGVDLTVELKKSFPHLPVILITNSKSAEVAVDAVQKGAYDFIVKPIHFPQLQISVERAIHFKSLKKDISQLRARIKTNQKTHGNMIGKSPNFLAAVDLARRVAKSKSNIFISGESGTGKEVFAKFIHNESNHANGPFVAINCSAIPETLLESELFGHAKGAFTGAHDKKIGLFEEAENGTIFLDEIGDLNPSLQAKLLRVLQERKIKRLGENQDRAINCRIITATHKNLLDLIQQGAFREDLYFRLNVIPVALPPLRERTEDIVPLAEFFLNKFAIENESPAKLFSREALKFILNHDWRGNVRELENMIERATVLARGMEITLDDLVTLGFSFSESSPGASASAPKDSSDFWIPCRNGLPRFDDVMNQYIEFAVSKNNGAKDKTAKAIGIDRKTLYKRLKTSSAEIST